MSSRIQKLLCASTLLVTTPAFAQHDRAPSASDLGIDTPIQVLFVGNSYLYYNDSIHNHIGRMVEEGNGIEDTAFDR